jgi:transmembrane protein 231
MAIFTVFTDSVIRQYKTSVVSKALLFQLIVIVITLLAPFFLAYSSRGLSINLTVFRTFPEFIVCQGFWLREGTYREQADVTFRREIVISLSGSKQSSRIFFSSFSNFNHLLSDQLRVPLIRVRKDEQHTCIKFSSSSIPI